MKKVFLLLAFSSLTWVHVTAQIVDITVIPDSVYKQEDVHVSEIALTSYMYNNSGNTVTMRWTRVVEQQPQQWEPAFCDKNLCYVGWVNTQVFELMHGDSGLLKPIFYINNTPGIGVMRVYYQSDTPSLVWADTAVYVAVAGSPTGTVETQLVRDLALYPNPAQNLLHVVLARESLASEWQISDASGRSCITLRRDAGTLSTQIDISALSPGTYRLNLLSGKNQILTSKPFVISR